MRAKPNIRFFRTFLGGALLLVLVSSCSAPQADEAVRLRGGLGYSGNVGEEGWPVETPQVEGAQVELRMPTGVIEVGYRDYVETKVRERRNIIFYVFHSGLGFNRPAQVSVEPVALPEESKCRVLEPWQDTHTKRSDGALQIEIGRDVPAGEYSFEFNVKFDGDDYGQLPCTIKVVK